MGAGLPPIRQQQFPPGQLGPGNSLEVASRGGSMPGIPDSVIEAVIHQESGGRANPSEPKGEPGRGLMQVTPQVAQQYGFSPDALSDPHVNRYVGTRYLNDLNKRFGGNLALTLAAYNAGPTRIARGEIPDSTRGYVRKILETIGRGVSSAIGEGTAAGGELKEIPDPWGKAVGGTKPKAATSAPSGLKDAGDPWGKEVQPKNSAEKLYERVRDMARTGVEYAIPANPDRPNPTDPQGVGALVARNVVPDDLKGAAINTALMGTGSGEANLATRLIAPALAGAGGAALQGDSPKWGAAEGAASGLGGEIAGGVTGAVGRVLGKSKLLSDTSKAVAEKIGGMLNSPADPFRNVMGTVAGPKDASELESLFTRRGIQQRIQQATAQHRNDVYKFARGVNFSVPEMKLSGKIAMRDLPLPEAEAALTKLGKQGFLPGGDVRSSVSSENARIAAYKARQAIAQKLNSIGPQALGDRWLAARKMTATGEALSRVFEHSGKVIDPVSGQLDQPKFIKAILDNYEDLVRNVGPKQTEELLRVARRGSKLPVSDVPAERGHMRFHFGIVPSYHPGSTYKPVGQIPALMRQAGRNPVTALAAMQIRKWLEQMGAAGGIPAAAGTVVDKAHALRDTLTGGDPSAP